MKKNDFLQLVANKAGLSKKDANAALDAILESISEVLENDDSISFISFGTFSTASRKARQARVPGTDRVVDVPESKAVKFKVGKKLKEAVAEK